MKCKLVVEDWRMLGSEKSIYDTSLGLSLSSGDLHSGTTFSAEVTLPEHIEDEIRAAMKDHGAYPVFRVLSGEHK